MRDYDQHLAATYGPDLDGEDDVLDDWVEGDFDYDNNLFYCADSMCDGHALPGARCTDPLDNTEEDEEVCP